MKSSYSKLLLFSSMGLEVGLSVIVGCFIGLYLDEKFGTEPWLLLIFMMFGIIAGYRSLYRVLKKMLEEEKENE